MSAAREETLAGAAPEPAKLRFAKLWWGIGWTIMALVIYGSLERPDTPTIPFAVSDKLVHFAAYWLMTTWFAGLLQRRRYPWLAIALFLFGGAIELLQGAMGYGRDADWRDLVANSLGILTALGVAYAGLGSWLVVIERRLGLAPS
jgi:VanZ family protein